LPQDGLEDDCSELISEQKADPTLGLE